MSIISFTWKPSKELAFNCIHLKSQEKQSMFSLFSWWKKIFHLFLGGSICRGNLVILMKKQYPPTCRPLVTRGLQVIWHAVMSEHCNYLRTLPAHMDNRDHEIIYRHILEEQETSYQDRNKLKSLILFPHEFKGSFTTDFNSRQDWPCRVCHQTASDCLRVFQRFHYTPHLSNLDINIHLAEISAYKQIWRFVFNIFSTQKGKREREKELFLDVFKLLLLCNNIYCLCTTLS